MSQQDTELLGRVFSNIYKQVDKHGEKGYDSVSHGAKIEAAGRIMAALILMNETMYHEES